MASATVSRLGVIDNAGPNTFKSFLEASASTAFAIDIGVAFITDSGLDLVLGRLKRTTTRGPVRVLTGLYQWFTEPKALRRLLAVQVETRGKLQVRLSSDTRFHWKGYFFFTNNAATISIGSSNLTDEGMRSSGEMNLTLSLPRDSPALKAMHKVFVAEWKRAKPLHPELIRAYQDARPANARRPMKASASLRSILGTRPRQPHREPTRSANYWQHSIWGYVSDETEQTLYEETDWDRKGYDWHSIGGPSSLEEGDKLVLFDFTSRPGWVYLVNALRVTETTRMTPNGRYFCAHRDVPRSHRRKLGPQVWARLRAEGLVRKRAQVESLRRMSSINFDRLVNVLRLR